MLSVRKVLESYIYCRPVTTSNSLQNAAAYMYQLTTEVYHVMCVWSIASPPKGSGLPSTCVILGYADYYLWTALQFSMLRPSLDVKLWQFSISGMDLSLLLCGCVSLSCSDSRPWEMWLLPWDCEISGSPANPASPKTLRLGCLLGVVPIESLSTHTYRKKIDGSNSESASIPA